MIIRQKNWWGARKHRHPKLATGKIWEVLFDRAVGVLANLPQSGAYLFCGPSLGELFILHSPPYSFSAFLLLCFFVFFCFFCFSAGLFLSWMPASCKEGVSTPTASLQGACSTNWAKEGSLLSPVCFQSMCFTNWVKEAPIAPKAGVTVLNNPTVCNLVSQSWSKSNAETHADLAVSNKFFCV